MGHWTKHDEDNWIMLLVGFIFLSIALNQVAQLIGTIISVVKWVLQ